MQKVASVDILVLSGSQIAAAGLGFLTTVVSARYLSPAEFGLAALALSYPALVWALASVKSVSITTRYMAIFRSGGRHEELRGVCKLGVSIDALIATLALIFVAATSSLVANRILHAPEISGLMIIYAASLPAFSLSGTASAVFSSFEGFRKLAVYSLIERVVGLVFVTYMLLRGYGLASAVIGRAIGNAVGGVAMMAGATWFLYGQGIGPWWKSSVRSLLGLTREIVSFMGWNYLSASLSGIISQIPLMMLGRFRGPEEAASFRLATSTVNVASHLEGALSRISLPRLSAAWAEGAGETIRALVARWSLRAGVPAAALVLLGIPLAPVLVPAVFGPEYQPAVPGIQIMLVGAAASGLFFWAVPLAYASLRLDVLIQAQLMLAALLVVIGSPVIWRWGFIGLCAVSSLGEILVALSVAARTTRRTPP